MLRCASQFKLIPSQRWNSSVAKSSGAKTKKSFLNRKVPVSLNDSTFWSLIFDLTVQSSAASAGCWRASRWASWGRSFLREQEAVISSTFPCSICVKLIEIPILSSLRMPKSWRCQNSTQRSIPAPSPVVLCPSICTNDLFTQIKSRLLSNLGPRTHRLRSTAAWWASRRRPSDRRWCRRNRSLRLRWNWKSVIIEHHRTFLLTTLRIITEEKDNSRIFL